MFDMNKSVKKMLGNTKPFGKMDFNNRVNSVNRVMKNLIGDRDGDKVINIMDCKPRDRTKHGGQLMWEKMKEKGIKFAKQRIERDDPNFKRGKEAYIEKDVQWHKDNLYKDDDYNKEEDVRIRKASGESYDSYIKERDIPRITKKEKKLVRKIFEKDPTLLEEAKGTTIYVRDPEDYHVKVQSKEEVDEEKRSNVYGVSPGESKREGETEWYSKFNPDGEEDSHLKIAPELLHRGIVGKTHSPQAAKAVYKLPLRQSKKNPEVIFKQEDIPTDSGISQEKKKSKVAGVIAHELKKRYQSYGEIGAKDAEAVTRSEKVPKPKEGKNYEYDPINRESNLEKEKKAIKKEFNVREVNILSPEEIAQLDILQREGKINQDQREKLLDYMEKEYRAVKIKEKTPTVYEGEDKELGRILEGLANMGVMTEPTVIQMRHRFAAQFKKREKVPEKVGVEKFRTMMDKGPVEPISKKEPQIKPGYTHTKISKDLLSEDTIKKLDYLKKKNYQCLVYFRTLGYIREENYISQAKYAELMTIVADDKNLMEEGYRNYKVAYITDLRRGELNNKIPKEVFVKELEKTVREQNKTAEYYKKKNEILEERFNE